MMFAGSTMGVKLKLWSLSSEDADSKLIGLLVWGDENSYAISKELLEDLEIVDWPFNFCDPNWKCHIKLKLKRLIKIGAEAFVISILEHDYVSTINKWKQVATTHHPLICDKKDVLILPHLNSDDPDFENCLHYSIVRSNLPCTSKLGTLEILELIWRQPFCQQKFYKNTIELLIN